MNILSDFKLRLNAFVPENETDQDIATLKEVLDLKNNKLAKAEQDVKKLKRQLKKAKENNLSTNVKGKTTKKKKVVKSSAKKKPAVNA